ncbi:hypothetical protein ACFVY1_03105 [Streptomyces sp. NPDC058293]|jgi:hypothetical protein
MSKARRPDSVAAVTVRSGIREMAALVDLVDEFADGLRDLPAT